MNDEGNCKSVLKEGSNWAAPELGCSDFVFFEIQDPEVRELLEQRRLAEQRFNWAETKEEIDLAIYKLKQVELKLNGALKRLREHRNG
jgi:hypothetical protein